MKRLQIEYKDINGIDTRIEVHQTNYSGAVTYREYASDEAACEIQWGDESSKRLPVVYGSQVTLRFDAETDFEFSDFFTSNSRKNQIFVYKNNVLAHVAFGEADTWSESLASAPYEVSLTGYDGLGLLSDEDFLQADKTPYTNMMTPLAIIQLVLSKTGLSLPINTAVGLRPLGTAGNPLVACTKDVITYAEMSCYEVLEALLQGCRVFQRHGEWWVVGNEKWTSTNITFYRYLANGSANGTVTKATNFTGFWFEGAGDVEYMPALKEMTVIQDYGYKPNLLNNADFAEINDAGNFDNWTAAGTIPEQRVYDGEGNKFVLLPGVELTAGWIDYVRTKYLVSDPVIVSAASDIFNVKFDFAVMGPNKSFSHVFWGMSLQVDGGADYALEAYLDLEDRTIKYRWKEFAHAVPIPANPVIKRTNLVFGPDIFTLDTGPTWGYPYNEVMNHFETATLSVQNGIPAAGEVRMYLFLAHTTSIVAGNCFKDIRLFITDEKEQEYPTNTELLIINDPANNYVPEDIELPNGDLPDLASKRTIYAGGFIGLDDEATNLWTLDGFGTNYTYADMIARMIAAEMIVARQSYQVAIADVIPAIEMVFVDDTNSNKKFIEAGITYNDRMQTIEGRYIELGATDIDAFTVAVKHNYKESGPGNKSSGKGGVIYSTDEKVRLIDPISFDVEGNAGYLNAFQFRQEVDNDTGRTVISLDEPKNRVTQIAHGFTEKTAIRHNGTAWVAAKADSVGNSAMGIVTMVYDANTFDYQCEGFFQHEDFTPGQHYYLSEATAGLITTTAGATVFQKIGFVTDRGLKIELSVARLTDGGETSALWHFEADTFTPANRTVVVNFDTAFTDLPAGVGNLKVYRLRAKGANSVMHNVLFTVASNWLTTTGFTLQIDELESLTGVKVDYCFMKKL